MSLDLQEIIDARRAKKSWDTIANELGRRRESIRKFAGSHPDFPPDLLGRIYDPEAAREQLRELVREGLTDAEIATELGAKSASAVARRRARLGVMRESIQADRRRRTKEELANAEQLLDEGYSFHAVTGMTGMNHETLTRHFPGRAYTKEQTIEAARMGRQLAKVGA